VQRRIRENPFVVAFAVIAEGLLVNLAEVFRRGEEEPLRERFYRNKWPW
jgi:hypothetical protein